MSPSAEAGPSSPRSDRRVAIAAVAGLVGLVVGAAAVGVPWLVSAKASAGGGGSDQAVKLPAVIGSYTRVADVEALRQAKEKSAPMIERVTRRNARSAERLSQSHGGAAATIESYWDAALMNDFTLLAVRDGRAVPPYVPYEDPASLGMARPTVELLTFGAVSCAVSNQPTPAGQQPAVDSVSVRMCVRSTDRLTVQAEAVHGDLGNRPAEVAALVDQAWKTLAGAE